MYISSAYVLTGFARWPVYSQVWQTACRVCRNEADILKLKSSDEIVLLAGKRIGQ